MKRIKIIIIIADFSYAESTTLSLLYNSYCMNVYGTSTISLLKVLLWHGEKQLEEIGD